MHRNSVLLAALAVLGACACSKSDPKPEPPPEPAATASAPLAITPEGVKGEGVTVKRPLNPVVKGGPRMVFSPNAKPAEAPSAAPSASAPAK